MIYVFYFFAALLVFLSARSFIGGIRYLQYFRQELLRPPSDFTPFVTVIAPCRGMDPGLEKNLRALLQQDYPAYEVIFVTDDETDGSVPTITALLDRMSDIPPDGVTARLVIAPKAVGCSQKVENLRESVLHAADQSSSFVFVDSDVRPATGWLRHLVTPLDDERNGAATGYRWFISNERTFGSEMRSAWNASIASALGPNTRSNFCWGGSMAIRRDVFASIDIREKWKGTLSDDFAVTHAMNEAGRAIVFVPQALSATIEDCGLGEMLEFTTRQMKITRVYARPLWLMSLFGSGVFGAVMITALLIVIISSSNNIPVFAAVTTLGLVTLFSTLKAWLRLTAVKLVLTDYENEIDRQFWTQNTLWILTPAVFFYNSLAALVSRRLTWRGTVYELKSPTETVIITD